MRRNGLTALVVSAFCAASAAGADDLKFVTRPASEGRSPGVRISFEVSAPTDVAVSIEDGEGHVLRHLAGGMLGTNAPAPLARDSLKQSLRWDGKDDAGKEAGAGPFKARVKIGTKPEFDGFLLHNPAATGQIVALATGPAGEVYLFHCDPTANGNMGGNKLKVISRDGTPVRSLMPMPATLPADRLKALGVFQTEDGKIVPQLHNYEQLSFYPDPLGSRGRSMPGYCSPAVDKQGWIYWLLLGPRLACLDKDGGVPYSTLYSEPLLQIKGLRMSNQYAHGFDRPSLAVSGDGKWIYFAGLFTGTGPKDGKPVPAVFRVSLDSRGPAEVFLGDIGKAGADDKSLAGPRGLAVSDGLVYIADFDNDRIMVFKEADRSLAGQVKIAKPDTLGVDPKSGALYVCCSTSKVTGDLVKIENYKTGKELYRMTLPRAGGNPWDFEHRIAVDASTNPVVIWLPSLSYSKHNLMRIEDAGDKFAGPVDPRDLKTPWAEGPRDMNVDRLRNELYVKANPERWYRLDEKTGKLVDILEPGRPQLGSSANGTQLIPGADGTLYSWSWSAGFYRFDRAGKPLNWPGQPTHTIPLGGIMCFQERHMELLGPEEFLIVLNPQWSSEKYEKGVHPLSVLFPSGRPAMPAKADARMTSIGVINPAGRLLRTVIWQCMAGATPRVDARGNIYLAEMVKPADRSCPAFFDGKLDPPAREERAAGSRFWTSYVYGSIIKFPPGGGAIWYRKQLPAAVAGEPPADLLAKPKLKIRAHIGYNPLCEAELQGADWFRFGFAPYSCWSTTSTDTCMCEGSRFDVDPFGRVFFPNLCQFRVEMIDTQGNPICVFGEYGNEDDGMRSAERGTPRSGIPLAWPTAVAVSDTHAYIGDTLNRRVVKVKLACAAEEVCEIR